MSNRINLLVFHCFRLLRGNKWNLFDVSYRCYYQIRQIINWKERVIELRKVNYRSLYRRISTLLLSWNRNRISTIIKH